MFRLDLDETKAINSYSRYKPDSRDRGREQANQRSESASSARERSKLMNEQTKNSIRERPSTIDRVDFTQSLPID